MGVHDARLHDALALALAHRGSHAQVKDEQGQQVEKRRERDGMAGLEHTGGHHRGNRIGGVVKAVHEVKGDGHEDEQGYDPEGGLCSLHAR